MKAFDLKGLKEVNAALKKMDKNAQLALSKGINVAAFNIHADARVKAPHVFGYLKQSIKLDQAEPSKMPVAQVTVNASYGRQVETGIVTEKPKYMDLVRWAKKKFGLNENKNMIYRIVKGIQKRINRTGRITATPFFFPAVDKHIKTVAKEVVKNYNKLKI